VPSGRGGIASLFVVDMRCGIGEVDREEARTKLSQKIDFLKTRAGFNPTIVEDVRHAVAFGSCVRSEIGISFVYVGEDSIVIFRSSD